FRSCCIVNNTVCLTKSEQNYYWISTRAHFSYKRIKRVSCSSSLHKKSLNLCGTISLSLYLSLSVCACAFFSFARRQLRLVASVLYGGREVQTNITKSETLLQSLRQIYILENIFTYHKTKLHYHNTFTSPETNLHFRKQIHISENKLTRRKTLLQVPKQIYKRH